jgi:CBS domain-containing protein
MKVRDVMTTEVVMVRPETPVSEVARLMVEHDISGVPVVDEEGSVIGVITELDLVLRNTRLHLPTFIQILDAQIYLETPGRYQQRLRHMLGTQAQDIMTSPAVTIGPDAELEEVADLMVHRRVNPVPVVDVHGRPVGIISRSDIVRLMAQ